MNCKAPLHLSMVVVSMLLLVSCGSTQLTSSWFDKDAPPRVYKKIAVVAMAPNKTNRGLIENTLAAELRANGLKGVNTLGVFPNAGNLDGVQADKAAMEKIIRDKMRSRGIDAIMLVSLLDVEEDQYVAGGDATFYKDAYYGGPRQPYAFPSSNIPTYNYSFYGYYSHYYSAIYSPTYYVNTTSYYLETSLFDGRSEKMIWSAQTTSTDPTSIKKEIQTFAELIVDQLLNDRVLVSK